VLHPYWLPLEAEFERHRNSENAGPMAKYMKNRFSFYGIKAPDRTLIQKEFVRVYGSYPPALVHTLIHDAWGCNEREWQYAGMEILEKNVRALTPDDIPLLETMITNKSWWDTVDLIATRLVGVVFKRYPDQIPVYEAAWMPSGNIWLKRTMILFQLKYKAETDTELLFRVMDFCLGSQEFFIQKAIGWALREYGKTDPEAVKKYVSGRGLSALSRREALRIIDR